MSAETSRHTTGSIRAATSFAVDALTRATDDPVVAAAHLHEALGRLARTLVPGASRVVASTVGTVELVAVVGPAGPVSGTDLWGDRAGQPYRFRATATLEEVIAQLVADGSPVNDDGPGQVSVDVPASPA